MRTIAAEKRTLALARINRLLEGTQGMTLTQIGAKLGVSKQRVFQMLRYRKNAG